MAGSLVIFGVKFCVEKLKTCAKINKDIVSKLDQTGKQAIFGVLATFNSVFIFAVNINVLI